MPTLMPRSPQVMFSMADKGLWLIHSMYICICLVNEGYHIIQQAQLGAPHPIKPHYFDSTPSNGNTIKYDYVDPINPIVFFV